MSGSLPGCSHVRGWTMLGPRVMVALYLTVIVAGLLCGCVRFWPWG